MELARIVEALTNPSSYSHPTGEIQVHHTHISVVFLAGPYAYKVKKPLDLGFLDFTTLEKRRHFCLEEVRLNSRLAPGVYLGVVPVLRRADHLHVSEEPIAPEPNGEIDGIVEYAVWMERLPDELTLESRVLRGEVESNLMALVARTIAAFHATADSGDHVAVWGRWEVVARNTRENFEQSAPQVGATVSAEVFQRVKALTETALHRLRPLIESRARAGVPRDTHGDLRLDHVYLFPERPAPRDLVVVDCIEFNERFRYADPVADMAFLTMDLSFYGRRDLARAFADAYFDASGDSEGRKLLAFYSAYRAAVRGKVEGFEALDEAVPEDERADALRRSRAHWLLALGELEEPGRRPCLVLVAGLPGTGKSTLAAELARRAGFEIIPSDAVRKQIAGLDPTVPAAAGFGEGIYTREWSEWTYAECLRLAQESLFAGNRVLVDANFKEEERRRTFLERALALGVPALVLLCEADAEVVKQRLLERTGSVSDADWAVYRRAAELWEAPGRLTRRALREVPCGGAVDEAVAAALEALRRAELYPRR